MKKIKFDFIKNKLAAHILNSILASGAAIPSELNSEQIYDFIVVPPKKDMGHLAFGCFTLAKALKVAPPQIAKSIADFFNSESYKNSQVSSDKTLNSGDSRLVENLPSIFSMCAKVEAAGPYVNFVLNSNTLFKDVLLPIADGTYFKTHLFEDTPRVMIEYSQPNTHKEIHVGHMRNACLGDSLIRILKYANFNVISSTFPGDVGTHVAKCLWYLKYHNQEPEPTNHKGEWLGRIYSKAHLKLEDELGSPQEEKNREQLTLILKQLEEKKGEYFEKWKETREWSKALMNEVYNWCDIKFDHWYWESDVDSQSVQWAKELFSQGKLIESQGAIGMDLSDKNLGFCLLLKSDGNGLYATKDIELARRKFEDFHIEKSIYVVDTRQALHFQQVFATLEKLNFPQAKECFHLQYNFVELPDGAMSSRKGNIVPLTDLVHQMENHVKTQYLSRYENEWTQDEIVNTSTIIAKGAIKYGMLKMDPNKKIVFDMKEWLKLEGDTGPYIQYAYARIQSLLRKMDFDESQYLNNKKININNNSNINNSSNNIINNSSSSSSSFKLDSLFSINKESEIQLAVALSQLNQVIYLSAENYKPSLLCNYLFDLAKSFSQFYSECPIANAETPELKQDRLFLSYATGLILKTGLAQLGIPVPQRM